MDDLTAALFLPDHEVKELKHGAKGTLSANAVPSSSFDFQVEHIYPIAEVRSGKNVFRATGQFVASVTDVVPLKPGMEGTAWIEVGQRRLGQALFGDLVDGLLMKLWL